MVRSAAKRLRSTAREAKFRENQKDSLKEMHPTAQEQVKSEEKEEKQKRNRRAIHPRSRRKRGTRNLKRKKEEKEARKGARAGLISRRR